MAFDPADACLRVPPNSSGYFSAAERAGIITRRESAELLDKLLRLGAEVSARYEGYFSKFFADHKTKVIFQHAQQLGYLSAAGLPLGSSHPDVLHGACPWPVVPERHLKVIPFRVVDMKRNLRHYKATPWTAWTAALDAFCLGLWGGLSPAQIALYMEAVHPAEGADVPAQELELRFKRISIPVFSNGFQGIVVGNFAGLESREEADVTTALLQFGQTLADIYFDLRSQHFLELAHKADGTDAFAKALILLLSPVETLIITGEAGRYGYALCREHNYWAGYRAMDEEAMTRVLADNRGFFMPLPAGFGETVYVEPVLAGTLYDRELATVGLKNCLARHFDRIAPVANGQRLSQAEVEHVLRELESIADNGQPSIAKLRQIYVLNKIVRNWPAGKVSISNAEMRRYLENMGRAAKNGYQISTYADEILKPFQRRLNAAKSRKGIMLQWRA